MKDGDGAHVGGRNDHGTKTYVDDPNVGRADHEHGGGYLYSRNHLLSTAGNVDEVIGHLRRLQRRPDPKGSTGDSVSDSADHDFGKAKRLFKGSDIVRIPLKEARLAMTVPEIVSELTQEGRPGKVAPDHVLVLGSHPWPFPANAPRRGSSATLLGPARSGAAPGQGVTVALFDGGVARGHQLLSGNVSSEPNSDDDEDPATNPLGRYAGHGTFIAGLVVQHAPGATILARKAFGADGHITDSHLSELIRERTPKVVDIVLLCCGGPTHDGVGLPATREALTRVRADNPNVAIVASAGNDAVDVAYSPAAFEDVIAVSAVTSDRAPACFSNFGEWVDACAPGVDAKSAFLVTDAQVQPVEPAPGCPAPGPARLEKFKGWAVWSGTSFAAPRVAGAIAAKMTEAGLLGDARAAAALLLDGQPKVVDGSRNFGVFVDSPPLRFR
jgi:hypothetical protein